MPYGVSAGWISGEGQAAGAKFGGASGARRALAWYPEEDLSTNVSLIITNVGADFTKLGSFGSAQGFAENLVASMVRCLEGPMWRVVLRRACGEIRCLRGTWPCGGWYIQ